MMPPDHQLYAGTLTDLANSMAKEIEDALVALRAAGELPPIPPSALPDLRMLFVAVAQGVVTHLKENEQAFAVTVNGTNPATGHPTIKVRSS